MNQKTLYNKMVRFYYRSQRKLNKLTAAGKNRRKQDILRRRVARLFEMLISMKLAHKKTAAAVALSAGLLLFQPTAAQSQISFVAVSDNPFLLTTVTGYSAPAFADLDNDGDLDLLVGDSYGNFQYFQNTGTNTSPVYSSSVTNPFGLTIIGSNASPAFADLDHDGDMDILAGDNSGSFFFFRNTGSNVSPAFAAPITNPFGLADIGTYSKPTFADLDHDGDLDMLAGEYDGNFFYFQNTGTNTAPAFASQVMNPFGLTIIGYNSAPAFADMDNDGDIDILAGEYQGQFLYLQNTGTNVAPAFAAPVIDPFNLNTVGSYTSPALADLDHDGDFDMLTGFDTGSLHYFENIGSNAAPNFKSAPAGPFGLLGNGGQSTPTFADIDHDGDLDMLSGEYLGHFLYLQNNGSNISPSFAQGVFDPYGLNGIGYNSSPAFADLDNDGDMDILSGDVLGHFYYFQNTGTNTSPAYAAEVTDPFGLTIAGLNSTPALADLDHDGDLDILSGDDQGHFHYFQNTGSNTSPAFAADVVDTFGLTVTGYFSTVAFADLDNDGDMDIIAGEKYGNFYYYQNTGNNTNPSFAAPLDNPFGLFKIGGSSAPTFADLDHDGDQDILSGTTIGDFYYFKNTSLFSGIGNGINFSATKINLFPNPTHDHLSIEITSKNSQDCSIRLLDLVGRQLMSDSFRLSEGSNLRRYSVGGYAKGIYMMMIEQEGMPSQKVRVVVE